MNQEEKASEEVYKYHSRLMDESYDPTDCYKFNLNTIKNNENLLKTSIFTAKRCLDDLTNENENLKTELDKWENERDLLLIQCIKFQFILKDFENRVHDQENASYNGTLLWKINNVQERIQEAKSGRQTSFYSTPFFTSQFGYKMCARIYLNGDGSGRTTYVSLFFVLQRGEYDALLSWPFRQKVQFTLLNQVSSDPKSHIIDAFRPDPNSSSFKRPSSDMNIASGLPLFCPISKISPDTDYTKDNTIFIKINVEAIP